jgi:hypothetical protein
MGKEEFGGTWFVATVEVRLSPGPFSQREGRGRADARRRMKVIPIRNTEEPDLLVQFPHTLSEGEAP